MMISRIAGDLTAPRWGSAEGVRSAFWVTTPSPRWSRVVAHEGRPLPGFHSEARVLSPLLHRPGFVYPGAPAPTMSRESLAPLRSADLLPYLAALDLGLLVLARTG